MNQSSKVGYSKVFPTSIIPPGEKLEPVRDAKIVLSSTVLEIGHLLVFLLVIGFISGFLSQLWGKLKKSKNIQPVRAVPKKLEIYTVQLKKEHKQ